MYGESAGIINHKVADIDVTIRVHVTRTEAAADTDTGVRREFFLRTAYIIIIFPK